MKIAYSTVMNHELYIREAAARYGILYTTLCDRVGGKVRFGSHSGLTLYLDDYEEAKLVAFLSGAASMALVNLRKKL